MYFPIYPVFQSRLNQPSLPQELGQLGTDSWNQPTQSMHLAQHITLHTALHYILHCAIHYTLHCTFYFKLQCITHCTLHWTLHFTLHCKLHYTLQFTLHITQHTTLHTTVHTSQCTHTYHCRPVPRTEQFFDTRHSELCLASQ